MKYTLLKDYLTTDGITIPEGAVFEPVTGRTPYKGKFYRTTVRKYQNEAVGEVSTRVNLPAHIVECTPEWFVCAGYWYIDSFMEPKFAESYGFPESLQGDRFLRKQNGNYFETELEAKVCSEGIKMYLTGQTGITKLKRPSGKVKAEELPKEKATTGTYDHMKPLPLGACKDPVPPLSNDILITVMGFIDG